MCYNMTQDHKNLVLSSITLGVCYFNLEKQMNVQTICLYMSPESSWQNHNSQRLIIVYMTT